MILKKGIYEFGCFKLISKLINFYSSSENLNKCRKLSRTGTKIKPK